MTISRSAMTRVLSRILLACGVCCATTLVDAWGDDGHEIVGQIASHYLQPAVRVKVFALLAADADPLTAHDFASETTWADKYRDSDRNTTKLHFLQTRQWHFVDMELSQPDIDAACFQHPVLPTNTPAEKGVAADCVVDKIEQFAAQLASPQSSQAEKLIALKFLMHFVGDLHQPLHASDDHDQGGNAKKVRAAGLAAGNLHGYWDTQFVRRLGSDPATIGQALIGNITPAQAQQWAQGTPADWAQETYRVSKAKVYGKLPKPDANGSYLLPAGYVNASRAIVSQQLSRAGVRLAAVLNRALGTQPTQ